MEKVSKIAANAKKIFDSPIISKKTSNFEPCTIGLLCKREKALFFNN